MADFDSLVPDRPLWTSARLADLSPVVINRENGLAFHDVCAHRKATILNGETQNESLLTCPYHGWTFDQAGRCKNGRLTPVSQLSLGGLGLVFAGDDLIDHDTLEDVATVFQQYQWSALKPLTRRRYSVRSHWSYWVENFLECYHCRYNHPQLCSVENHIAASSSGDYSALGSIYNAAGAELTAMGAHRPFATDWDPEEAVPAFIDFNTLVQSHGSATQSGKPVGPPATVFDQHTHVFYYGAVGPFFHFSLYSDHLFLTNFYPSGDNETVIDCCWIGHERATMPEGDVVWLWENTMVQDIELVTRLHVGRSLNVGADPVFLDSEEQSAAFHDWFNAQPEAKLFDSRSSRI